MTSLAFYSAGYWFSMFTLELDTLIHIFRCSLFYFVVFVKENAYIFDIHNILYLKTKYKLSLFA